MRAIEKPNPNEFPAYAETYMRWLPDDGQLLNHLKNNFEAIKRFVLSLPEDRLHHRPTPEKWSIKETLVHIVDDERIYAYRAMCFARNEDKALPGFKQDHYTSYSGADARSITCIMDEYEAVRSATIALFKGLPTESLTRSGVADWNCVTVRALGYHIAGHEVHHFRLLMDKYF